jgi:hypothetical protein
VPPPARDEFWGTRHQTTPRRSRVGFDLHGRIDKHTGWPAFSLTVGQADVPGDAIADGDRLAGVSVHRAPQVDRPYPHTVSVSP